MADNQFIAIPWRDSEANPSLLIGLRKVSQASDIRVSYYERVPDPSSIASAADVVEEPSILDAPNPIADAEPSVPQARFVPRPDSGAPVKDKKAPAKGGKK